MSLEHISSVYGVNAKRGARIRFTQKNRVKEGEIIGSKGQGILVKFDGVERPAVLHPTNGVQYLSN